ncbi:MAG: hypothetical protein ACRDVE_15225 [Actinocrinis sp.]
MPDPERADDRAVLVVDGIFLHRDGLAEAWDFSVFLDIGFESSVARMAERDGAPPDVNDHDPRNQRYVGGQQLYLEACAPQERASMVVDNSDFATPVIRRDR